MTDERDRMMEELAARLATASSGSASGGAAARVAAILDALGWRAASEEPAAAVAPPIALMLDAYGRHGDAARLRRGIAEHLRLHAHPLDGSGSPTAAWEPMAAELIARFQKG